MAGNPLRAIVALYRDAFGGLPALTWLLCTAGFINRCGSMVVPFLSPYLEKQFGYSPTTAGIIVSVYGTGALIGSLLGGWLTDRLGPVRLQVVALGSSALWMLAMTQVETSWLLVPGMLVLGLLNDAFRPGSNTAAVMSVGIELRRKALSLNRLAMNLGWTVGPTIGGYLVEVDFRLMFVANGLSCGLAAAWLAVALRGWHPAPPPHDPTDLRGPFRDRHFLLLMLANLVVLVAFMQYFTTGSRVLADQGYSKVQIGWFLAINPVMIALFEMLVVHRLRARQALPLVAIGSLVVGLGYCCMLLPIGWLALVVAMVVVAAGELLQMPMLAAHVNDHATPHARGAYNGAYGMTFCLALVLAPGLGGWLYDAAGAAVLWWTSGACGLVAALGFLWCHRHPPRAAPPVGHASANT